MGRSNAELLASIDWREINAAVLAYVEALTGAEAEDVRRMAKRELERLKVKHGG